MAKGTILVGTVGQGIMRSMNYGETWQRLSVGNGLHAEATVRCLATHPKQANVVYAGTDRGFYHSDDGGHMWTRDETPIGEHARGCYEIELVVEKIRRPAQSDQFELPEEKRAQIEEIHRAVVEAVAAAITGKKNDRAIRALAAQPYFPTYEIVRSRLAAQNDIDEATLKEALRRFLPLVRFDEELYLRLYPDVKQAIDTGALTSARDHFVVHGYFEGRVFQEDPVYLDFTPEKGD